MNEYTSQIRKLYREKHKAIAEERDSILDKHRRVFYNSKEDNN